MYKLHLMYLIFWRVIRKNMFNNIIIKARILLQISIGYFKLCCALLNDWEILLN